jgi:hypothetical protein
MVVTEDALAASRWEGLRRRWGSVVERLTVRCHEYTIDEKVMKARMPHCESKVRMSDCW